MRVVQEGQPAGQARVIGVYLSRCDAVLCCCSTRTLVFWAWMNHSGESSD